MGFIEQFSNNAATSLSGSITSGSLTLAVTSAALFPPVPQFRLGIDSEYLLVTGVSGNTWGVQRAVEGSLAAAHASGATVTQILTASGLIGVAGSICLTGPVAALPSTGFIGRLYFPSDASYIYQEETTGWSPYGPLYPMAAPVPALSSWTPLKFPTAGSSSGQVGGTIRVLAAASASSVGTIIGMSSPATGYTITALVFPEVGQVNYNCAGIGWRDSVSDKQALLFLQGGTAGIDLAYKYALNSTSYFASTYAALTSAMVNQTRPVWLRLQDDGTNRTVSYSFNGYTFTQLDQRARTYYDGATTMTPDQVVLFAASINASAAAAVSLYSWVTTHP